MVLSAGEEAGGNSYEQYVEYEGNKLRTIADENGYVFKYFYRGDFIVRIEAVDEDGKLDVVLDYYYDGDRMISRVERGDDAEFYYTTHYTHNSDGTVSYQSIITDVVSGKIIDSGTFGKQTFLNGNLIKDVGFEDGDEKTEVYEYDDESNPFRNVRGVDRILGDKSNIEARNNVVKKTYILKSAQEVYVATESYSYKYGANGYPIEMNGVFESQGNVSVKKARYYYQKVLSGGYK